MRDLSSAGCFALAAAGLFLLAAGPLACPAAAQSTSLSEQIEDIRNAVGLAKSRPPIDYTERPPIVVPPSYTLPPPGSADPEVLSVNDPDMAARRRALTDSRRPVPPSDPGAAAAGLSARSYLTDPPSGLRDPAAVAADITHDSAGTAAPVRSKPARTRRKKTAARDAAAQ